MDSFEQLNDRINAHQIEKAKLNADIRNKDKLLEVYQSADERSAVLSAIVDSSDDAIISKDLEGTVTSWNPAAERIFGYAAREMIGASILILIPADRLDEERQILNKLRKGEYVDHFQTMRQKKNGDLVHVSLSISPVRNIQGKIIGVSKIARDITALKLGEEKSAILSAIIASSDDAIISKDLNSVVTSWNPAAQRIFGYPAAEMIGESILKLIPEDRLEEEPLILSKLKAGQRVDHFETKRLTKHGKLIDVSLTISPVYDTAGKLIGLSKIARDITDKKLEEQRKNDFIAIVSHELKTPLTSLKSYIQMALGKARKNADDFSENMLVRAEQQTRKMTAMIHDFLNVSRLEEGKMALTMSHFSLPLLMDEVISEGRLLAPAHIIECTCSTELDLYADQDKIGQVMINLLSNAVKYSDPGTTITVNCEVANNQVIISFTDQGIGISENDQVKLFERFYRVEQQNPLRHVTGFGIGLYLVAEILKLHDSAIRIESSPGEGSTFSFSLRHD